MFQNNTSYRTDDDDKFGKRHIFTVFQRISQFILTLILILAILSIFVGGRNDWPVVLGILMSFGVSLLLLAHVELLTRIPPTDTVTDDVDLNIASDPSIWPLIEAETTAGARILAITKIPPYKRAIALIKVNRKRLLAGLDETEQSELLAWIAIQGQQDDLQSL